MKKNSKAEAKEMTYTVYTVKVYANGDKFWYVRGKLSREDGPAVEYADGSKAWYLNGKCHREDGPACEWADGSKEWYLKGKSLTEKEFNKRKKSKKSSCAGRVSKKKSKN